MIRNIVFDMGMVLLEYDPVRCAGSTDNPEDVSGCAANCLIRRVVAFRRGTLTDAQSAGAGAETPQMNITLAKESLEHWHCYNIWAKPGMGELVKELKEGLRHLPLLELSCACVCSM